MRLDIVLPERADVGVYAFFAGDIGATYVNRQWVRARRKGGLPGHLVLYCARHDYGSFVLSKTGNLKAVMDLMGQRDYRSALKYQHHEIDVARDLLNSRHTLRNTAENDNHANA